MDKAGNDVSHGKRERTPSGPETVIGIDVRGWSPGRIVVRFRRRYRASEDPSDRRSRY
jgi:hypothetical protein